MKATIGFAMTCLLALTGLRADAAAAATPHLAQDEKVLVADNFDRPEMKPVWRNGKGKWEVKDGVVTGAELADDKHAAYTYLNPLTVKDLAVEFSFKFDGGKAIHFMFDDSKYKGAHAGHICRASFYPDAVEINDMKNGSMANENYAVLGKDSKATPEEKKAVYAKIKGTNVRFPHPPMGTAWHKARIELVGDEMLVLVDGVPSAYMKAPGIDHENKSHIGLQSAGLTGTASFKEFKLMEATAAPGWTSARETVIGSLPKAPAPGQQKGK